MFVKHYWAVVVWLVVVTVLSVTPGGSMPQFNLISADKVGHAAAYAVLAWLLFRAYKSAKARVPNWKECIVIFCISAGYGILMEFVQGTFFPTRFFEVDDMLANAFGALVATLGAKKLRI